MTERTHWFCAEQLTDGIRRIWEPHVHRFFRANLFHVIGKDTDLIIDFGMGLAPLRPFLNIETGKPVIGLATHVHADHIGSFHEFEHRLGPAAEADGFAGMEDAVTLAHLFRELPQAVEQKPVPSFDQGAYEIRPAPLGRVLGESDTIDIGGPSYKVLHLPGHSPGSIGLLDEASGIFFSGDAIYDGTLVDDLPGCDKSAYRKTMHRLRDLDISVAYGGHGAPMSRERMRTIANAYLDAAHPSITKGIPMTDPAKLEALRMKYADAAGGDIFDPAFAAVARGQFKGSDRRKWPFAGIPTFLDAPCRPDAQDLPDFGGIDIALLGVPMDLGVTNRNGSRFGPRAVRTIERIGPYDHVLKCAPFSMAQIADIGDVPMKSRFDLALCHQDIETFYKRLVGAGVRPLPVGGDHSISASILKAVGEKRPVGMIHIDAHCDTAGPYEGAKFQHGGPFRLAVLDGVLDPERTIQIGIRGGAEYLWEFSYDSGMTMIHAEEVADVGMAAVIEKARQIVGDGPTYLSFDIDSVDPGFAPGTGTPEVGGLLPADVLRLLRGLQGINFVGGDVVEVAPQYDTTTNTAQIAAQVMFTILCLMVSGKS